MSGQRTSDPAASMALLTTVLDDAEQQYRGARPGAASPGPGRVVALLVTSATIGLLIVASVVQWRTAATQRSQERDELVHRIETLTAELDARQDDLARQQQLVARAEQDAVGRTDDGARLADQLAAVEAAAARTGVVGPGVTVTLQDAEADAVTGLVPEGGEVLDRDVQLVANGLWRAGAEAVAVNGHRLGSTTAIRAAGQAILVDLRPIAPPYVVAAVGDAGVGDRFAAGPEARQLQELSREYGLRWQQEHVTELVLPPASGGRS